MSADLFDKITGATNKYVSPRGLIYTGSPAGSKDYLRQGFSKLELLKEEVSLQPNDSVLDIGSGVGRTAIAISTYLGEDGSYDGFDVVKQRVDWCNDGLGKDFSNLKFKYVSFFNDLYNTSEINATDFKLPYEAKSFFVFIIHTYAD